MNPVSSVAEELLSASPPQLSGPQLLVARAGSRRLAFPARWVDCLLLVARSQVLALPFYSPAILGVIHHQGQLVPLVRLRHLFDETVEQLSEVFNGVRLSPVTGLGGVGLAVDQILGNFSDEQVAADPLIEPFQLQWLQGDLFSPLRWQRPTG